MNDVPSPGGLNVGLFATSYFEPGVHPREGLRELVEQVELAEELGFGSVLLGHHYLTQSSFLQPLTLSAYLARVTERMKIGFCVFLLPLHNPVVLAEELATLDVLMDGRLVLGVGTGYREREYDAVGIPIEEKFARFDQHMHLMRRLWQGDVVTDEGPYGKLSGSRLKYAPARPGGPPFWIGAVGDRGFRRVAEHNGNWLAGSVEPHSDLPRKLDVLRAELEKAGLNPDRPCGLMREAAVCESREEAVNERVRHAYEMFRDNYHTFFNSRGKLSEKELVDDLALVGTPDEVISKLRWYRELGFSDVVLRIRWGGLSHEQTLDTIRLIGKEVLPALSVPANG